MTTANAVAQSQSCKAASVPDGLAAVIAYENFASGLAAKYCLDQLEQSLGINSRLTLFRLDLLKEPVFAAQAVKDAAVADVVLLSLNGEPAMTPAVKEWLGAWLYQHHEKSGALGVLLDTKARRSLGASRTLSFLQWATQRCPIDLYVGYFHAKGDVEELPV